jgi:hypothetical protein
LKVKEPTHHALQRKSIQRDNRETPGTLGRTRHAILGPPRKRSIIGYADCEAAVFHSSKVRTDNRPFALYKIRISSPHSSISHRRGR